MIYYIAPVFGFYQWVFYHPKHFLMDINENVDHNQIINTLIDESHKKLEENPESFYGHVNRSALYYYRNNFDSCISETEVAITLNDHCGPAWYNRGCAYYRLSNYKEAELSFAKASRWMSKDPYSRYNRGISILAISRNKLQ